MTVTAARGLLAGVLLSVLGVAACGSTSSSSSGRPGRAAGAVWLCRPGQAPDPCTSRLGVSAVAASGAVTTSTWPRSALASKFACFYVYPTVSLAATVNTALVVTEAETYVALEQAAPLSNVCDVWAPVYRSQTWTTVKKQLAGDEAIGRSSFAVAYNSLLPAWRSFLSESGGKPIILIGDSQGSAMLIHLISAELDHDPSVLRRLLVAVIVGGNLQVPVGKRVGATFTKVPLCTSDSETGCAIAFSSYPSQPPQDSVFGRPGQGVSLQSGQTARAGQQVACVSPAALGGGSGTLDPYVLKATQLTLTESVPTPWVTYPDLYSASCKQGGGASWLQVTSLAGTSRTRPVVNDDVVGNYGGGTGPAWGFHSYEFSLTIGNLLQDVVREEAAWDARDKARP